MPRAEAVVITVQYGNPADTATLAASLARVEMKESIRLVIVDNSPSASANKTDVSLDAPFPVHRISSAENVYYWGGAALALQSINFDSHDSPSWVVICNNDVEFTKADFFSTLFGLDRATHPIVAPSIISTATGWDQNPMLREKPAALTRLRWRLYDSAYPVAKVMLAIRPVAKNVSHRQTDREIVRRQRIFAPHGACVVLSSEFFARGGQLDTAVPLFAEELTLGVEASERNLPVWYLPELQVTHREHSTTGTRLTRAKYDLERKARERFYQLEATLMRSRD